MDALFQRKLALRLKAAAQLSPAHYCGRTGPAVLVRTAVSFCACSEQGTGLGWQWPKKY